MKSRKSQERAEQLARIPLYQQLVKILKQNPENAYSTRRHREDALTGVVQCLWEHFRLRNLHNLQAKHAEYLVSIWKAADNGKGNLQNDLSHLRWFLEKLGKKSLVPERNADLKVPAKARNVRQGKFIGAERQGEILSGPLDAKLKALVQLALQFGMRFEEASLFRPQYDVTADATGAKVWIKRGTKGGRPRFVPIVTQSQRDAVAMAQSLVAEKEGCFIDKNLSFIQWKNRAYKEFRKAGLSRANGSTFHDLRRTYAAMERLRLLAKGHTVEQAAKIVSKRLGHNRIEILSAYIAWSGGGDAGAQKKERCGKTSRDAKGGVAF